MAQSTPDWEAEREHLLEIIRKQEEEAARTAKRFKLLQKALLEQQAVLDQYQQALLATGLTTLPAAKAPRSSGVSAALLSPSTPFPATSLASQVKSSPSCSIAESKEPKDPSSQQHTKIKTEKNDLPTAPPPQRTISETHQDDSSWVSRRHEMTTSTSKSHAVRSLPPAPRPASRASSETPLSSKTPPPAKRPRVQPSEASTEDDFLEDAKPASRPLKTLQNQRSTPSAAVASSRRHSTGAVLDKKPVAATFRSRTGAEDKENAFPYLEVVRNREQRAALPGHDCAECRKYYEALDGLVSESEIKAKCSRHRARHEPYQTPDDFWRLSFPDSEPAPFSP
ncbi:hypothetical protein PINS_up004573 [Pythium insidiosum]|nr:hypothetical protein PINS_up004573 [Pythium insidiosum]